jgi:peptidoglycan/LPS O-acetylase OafA/YrhL
MHPQLARPEPAAVKSVNAAKRSRIAALDGLRFVAALSVVVYHYTARALPWHGNPAKLFPTINHFSVYGWMGVQLFFLISGFVICMSSWGRTLGDFFVSRVVRLYPAYWIAVLLTASVLTIWPAVWPVHSLQDVLANLTMLQEPLGIRQIDGVYWTLWAEMKFYLLFAIVIWRGLTYRSAVLFCLLWTVASVVARQEGGAFLDILFNPQYSPYFIAGVAFYLIHRFRPTPLLWGIVAVSYLIAQRTILDRHGVNDLGHKIPLWPMSLILTIFFAVMAALALGKLSWIRGRWLTAVGALTYPLYLIHEQIGWTLIRGLKGRIPNGVLVVAVAAAMILLAWLIHRLVERPLAPRLRRAISQGVEEMRHGSRNPEAS